MLFKVIHRLIPDSYCTVLQYKVYKFLTISCLSEDDKIRHGFNLICIVASIYL